MQLSERHVLQLRDAYGYAVLLTDRCIDTNEECCARSRYQGKDNYLHRTDTTGRKYLSLPLIPTSGTTLLNYTWFAYNCIARILCDVIALTMPYSTGCSG